MSRLDLIPAEIEDIDRLLAYQAARFGSSESEEFLAEAAVIAHELPRRVRKAIYDFKLHEPQTGICIISGFPVDDQAIGDTPTHWKLRTQPTPTIKHDMLLVLLGQLLGEPIGWVTQQDGYIVHDISPIQGNEQEQLGSGSETLLWWHVEDAFHPFRGDYLAMLCLRNHDHVPTTFANLAGVQLDPKHWNLLFEDHYTIRPDESHLAKNKGNTNGEANDSYQQIDQMNTEPVRIAVLHGDRHSPYIRCDPYFMDPVKDNPEAQEALDALVEVIDNKIEEVVLKAGDYCLIDNYKAVHGRKPFKARYDGTDRWLKRINVARDLRKSREARAASHSRVIL